jgi:uncharacterized protein YqeY
MSPLQERIQKDSEAAMKAQKSVELQTLRLLSSSIHNREIEKKGKSGSYDLTDDEVIEVVKREAKKRKEAIELYEKGGRPELAMKESEELAVLGKYLPEEMSEDEVRRVVREVISGGGFKKEDFGRAMGAVMKQMKGRADASTVSRILKEEME